MKLIYIYLIAINFIAFFIYGMDKRKAKRGKWRISETTLISVAVIGGSIGAYAGMRIFRHKTKHAKFTIGIPVILAIQAAAAVYFTVKSGGAL